VTKAEISVQGLVERASDNPAFPPVMIVVKVEPESGVRLLTVDDAERLATDLNHCIKEIDPGRGVAELTDQEDRDKTHPDQAREFQATEISALKSYIIYSAATGRMRYDDFGLGGESDIDGLSIRELRDITQRIPLRPWTTDEEGLCELIKNSIAKPAADIYR
jgi:hypothetical protein